MNKENFLEYFKTFFITILATFLIVIGLNAVIKHNVFEAEQAKQVEDESIDYYLIGLLIEKNKYLEIQNPKDYRINLRLGVLYEIKRDFKTSESEFKKSISKAPYDEFRPHYKLADLYIRLNRLDEAEALMDNIEERPDVVLINYKGEIYTKIGDKYYNAANYEEAIPRYQKALFYYKVINSNKISSIRNSLASSFVYLADQKVAKMQIDDAISSLKTATTLINAPIIRYKLALLMVSKNPDIAYRYFDEVFKKEPAIINYSEYYNFLTQMALRATNEGKFAEAELYRFKIRKLKEFYKGNILETSDIYIDDVQSKLTYRKWRAKYKVNFSFVLKNVSDLTFNSLYVTIVLKDGDKILDSYTEKIADTKEPLRKNVTSPIINIKTSFKASKDEIRPKEITAQIFASKNETSYKLLLQEYGIREHGKIQQDIF